MSYSNPNFSISNTVNPSVTSESSNKGVVSKNTNVSLLMAEVPYPLSSVTGMSGVTGPSYQSVQSLLNSNSAFFQFSSPSPSFSP
jgi:hypothetical protein